MYIIQEDAAGLAQWTCCSAVRSVTERSHRPCRPLGAHGQLLGRVRALCGHIGQPTFGRLAPIGAATLCGGPPRALPALHPSATSGAAHAVPHPSGPIARSLTRIPARSCTRSCCTQALSTHAHAHVHAAAAHVAAVRKHVRRGQPGGRFDRSCTAANQSAQPHRRA